MINKMKALYLMHEKGYIPRLDMQWEDTAQKLYESQRSHKELDLHIKMLQDKLIDLSLENNSCGRKFYFHEVKRKGCIDYTRVDELKSVDIEKYRKNETSYWKLECYE